MNRTLAKAISIVFNPLLMPTFLLATFYFFSPEIAGVTPVSVPMRWGFLGFINVYTFLLPILMIYFMYTRKWIQTITLKNLKERRLPYLITAIFYFFLCYFLYSRSSFFYPTSVFVFFSAIVIVIVAIVSLWWQISAHSAAIGGTFGAFFVMNFKYEESNLFIASLVALVLSGAVMSARLRLDAHSLAQVVAGFGVGFAVSLAGYVLL